MLVTGRAEHSEALHKAGRSGGWLFRVLGFCSLSPWSLVASRLEVMFTWAVAQKYIEEPYLKFGGSKFHMRLYILVTSWETPAIFLFNEGFLFRSRHKYDATSPSVEKDVFSAVSDDVENLALSSLWSHLGDLAADTKQRLLHAPRLLRGMNRCRSSALVFCVFSFVDSQNQGW